MGKAELVKQNFENLFGLIKLTGVHWGFSDVTDSGSLNNVSDNKLLDCLILWHATCAVCAPYRLNMATIVLATSSITAFLGLKYVGKTSVNKSCVLKVMFFGQNRYYQGNMKTWSRCNKTTIQTKQNHKFDLITNYETFWHQSLVSRTRKHVASPHVVTCEHLK